MSIFQPAEKKKIIIGVIHLPPLPGTPLYKEQSLEFIINKAKNDAVALNNGGASGCLLQSIDKIYPAEDDADYARVSAMAVITYEVRKVTGPDFHVGLQILWNCITPSLAVAKVCNADFIRVTKLIGISPSQYGLINANPLKVMNYRKLINAENIAIVAEIVGYHTKNNEEVTTISQKASDVFRVGANAVEVYHFNEEKNNNIVHNIKKSHPKIPVILGGGTNLSNIRQRLLEADGAFVGSCFENNNRGNKIDEDTVKKYMNIVETIE